MATSEHSICDECGEPLDDDADFAARADLIAEALDGADEYLQMTLLTMFMGIWLSRWDAEDKRTARRDLIRDIDSQAREWTIAGCDA